MNDAKHWNEIYASKPHEALGWYEQFPYPSVALIDRCDLNVDSVIMDVGSGAGKLLPYLIGQGYTNLIALDHSQQALGQLKESIPHDRLASIRCFTADILSPDWLEEVDDVALWHDRALFHFFVAPADQETYADRLRSVVKVDGYVVIGVFSLQGARQCSGLPVQRYSAETLSRWIGSEFRLIESMDYLFKMPAGDTRPYTYALFKRMIRG
jgi:SAM-dependent methyltransferase